MAAAHEVGRNNLVGPGPFEVADGVFGFGAGQDEDVGIELAGDQGDIDVGHVGRGRCYEAFGPFDAGLDEDFVFGGIPKDVEDVGAVKGQHGLRIHINDHEIFSGGRQVMAYERTDAAVAADYIMVIH